MHPYEYLTQVNSLYASCNKANTKSYSSVSKIKLPWKPFNILKIPQVHFGLYSFSRILTFRRRNSQASRWMTRREEWRRVRKNFGRTISKFWRNIWKRRNSLKENLDLGQPSRRERILLSKLLAKRVKPITFFCKKLLRREGIFPMTVMNSNNKFSINWRTEKVKLQLALKILIEPNLPFKNRQWLTKHKGSHAKIDRLQFDHTCISRNKTWEKGEDS